MKNKQNFQKLSKYSYFVKNQNGLNNAIYDFYEANDVGSPSEYSKKELRQALQNFPKKYPCEITIIDEMFECWRFYLDIRYDITPPSRFYKLLLKIFKRKQK